MEAMTTRRGVGRVRHLYARLLWLQQLCAEGVAEVRAKPGTHNETDTRTAIDWTAARYILSVMKTQLSVGRLTVCAPELTWPVILCAPES